MRSAGKIRPASRPRARSTGSQPKRKELTRPPVDDMMPAYYYRCMCHDGSDLWCHPDDRAFFLTLDDHEMRECAVQNIVQGSKFRSPFLHASHRLEGACQFYKLGAPPEGMSRDPRNVVIRFDVKAMLRKGSLHYENILDLSTEALWKRYFQNSFDDWGDYVEEHVSHAITMAVRSKEVLLLYRGKFSFEDAWIVDPLSGAEICKFDALAPQAVSLGSQPKVKAPPWKREGGSQSSGAQGHRSRSSSAKAPWLLNQPSIDSPSKPTRPARIIDLVKPDLPGEAVLDLFKNASLHSVALFVIV